ncbi:MAG: ATPase, T2SS/T4P/T4SS family, partial [Mobilitalea sp.]
MSESERVITIEDTPELHYREINPDKDCVELMVSEGFGYTKAIKTSLRQNPKWLMLSEARSVEVKYLLESLSTGIRGFTTIHTDDVRKIPDRILNMLESRMDADRMENDIYMFI